MAFQNIVIVVLLVSVSASVQDWDLIWEEEFNGNEIDDSRWSHVITASDNGNSEFQQYVPAPENIYVKDGLLHIKPSKVADNINPLTGEPFGEDFLINGVLDLNELYGNCTLPPCRREGANIPPVASAKIESVNKFSFRYGRVEIRAKMPVGDWLWPAMWLMPQRPVYGVWPRSGEIDMVEIIGNRDLVCGAGQRGIAHMGSALHWGTSYIQNRFPLTYKTYDDFEENFGDYFHTYTLDWTPQGIIMGVDGIAVNVAPEPSIGDRDPGNCWTGFYDYGFPNQNQNPWTDERTCHSYMAPFDQEFFLILNVAVGSGSGFMPDGCVNSGGKPGHEKPWLNGGSRQQMMGDFYSAQDAWFSTWSEEGENNALQVDYIRVYQPTEGFPRSQVPAGCDEMPGPDVC